MPAFAAGALIAVEVGFQTTKTPHAGFRCPRGPFRGPAGKTRPPRKIRTEDVAIPAYVADAANPTDKPSAGRRVGRPGWRKALLFSGQSVDEAPLAQLPPKANSRAHFSSPRAPRSSPTSAAQSHLAGPEAPAIILCGPRRSWLVSASIQQLDMDILIETWTAAPPGCSMLLP